MHGSTFQTCKYSASYHIHRFLNFNFRYRIYIDNLNLYIVDFSLLFKVYFENIDKYILLIKEFFKWIDRTKIYISTTVMNEFVKSFESNKSFKYCFYIIFKNKIKLKRIQLIKIIYLSYLIFLKTWKILTLEEQKVNRRDLEWNKRDLLFLTKKF